MQRQKADALRTLWIADRTIGRPFFTTVWQIICSATQCKSLFFAPVSFQQGSKLIALAARKMADGS
jgi:hypothetical protein